MPGVDDGEDGVVVCGFVVGPFQRGSAAVRSVDTDDDELDFGHLAYLRVSCYCHVMGPRARRAVVGPRCGDRPAAILARPEERVVAARSGPKLGRPLRARRSGWTARRG